MYQTGLLLFTDDPYLTKSLRDPSPPSHSETALTIGESSDRSYKCKTYILKLLGSPSHELYNKTSEDIARMEREFCEPLSFSKGGIQYETSAPKGKFQSFLCYAILNLLYQIVNSTIYFPSELKILRIYQDAEVSEKHLMKFD